MEGVKSEGLHCDPILEMDDVEWMKPRGRRSGVIKVEFRSQQDKMAVLHRKQRLRDNDAL